jgi:hypothetical protein
MALKTIDPRSYLRFSISKSRIWHPDRGGGGADSAEHCGFSDDGDWSLIYAMLLSVINNRVHCQSVILLAPDE